jgi:hypothetical protein
MATCAAWQTPAGSKAKYAARGVHLDQDTAGRLLENMGDHVRREMIVRITQVIRQNPAYRPFAHDSYNLRRNIVGGCLFFQTQMSLNGEDYAS